MHLIKSLLIFFIVGTGFRSAAQNPPNWTANQLIEPSELANNLKSNKNLPIIFSVGPGALIPNSIDLGPAKDEDNLKKLKEKYDKAESNFEKCQNYTGQLAEVLANASVDEIPVPPPYDETRSLIEVPAKK